MHPSKSAWLNRCRLRNRTTHGSRQYEQPRGHSMKTFAPFLNASSATTSKAAQMRWKRSQCSRIFFRQFSPLYQLMCTQVEPPVHGHESQMASPSHLIADMQFSMVFSEVKSISLVMGICRRPRDHRVRQERRDPSSQQASTSVGSDSSAARAAWLTDTALTLDKARVRGKTLSPRQRNIVFPCGLIISWRCAY